MPHLTPLQWLLAAIAAMGIGVSKAGFAGVGLGHVLIFAFLFGARESTGIALPMLVAGDVTAVSVFRQHAHWEDVREMLPPAALGVLFGVWLMPRLSDLVYKPVIGWIILTLSTLQLAQRLRPAWFGHVPHARGFAWGMGLLAGVTTMLANAAGPIIAIYGLARSWPKLRFVGTSAWFFLIINTFKIPFSVALGLIHVQTLLLNLLLVPAVVVGLFAGRWLTRRVPQKLFDGLLLAFAAVAALRLIGAV